MELADFSMWGAGLESLRCNLPMAFATLSLDPEPAMLEEAARLGPSGNHTKFQWILGRAEEVPELRLGSFRAVTLAQSFHWTDKARVAETVYDPLDDGGSMLLIHHESRWPPSLALQPSAGGWNARREQHRADRGGRDWIAKLEELAAHPEIARVWLLPAIRTIS